MLFLSIYYQKNIVTDAGDANMSRVAQLKNCLWKCHMSDEVTYNSGAILNLAMVEERFNSTCLLILLTVDFTSSIE